MERKRGDKRLFKSIFILLVIYLYSLRYYNDKDKKTQAPNRFGYPTCEVKETMLVLDKQGENNRI